MSARRQRACVRVLLACRLRARGRRLHTYVLHVFAGNTVGAHFPVLCQRLQVHALYQLPLCQRARQVLLITQHLQRAGRLRSALLSNERRAQRRVGRRSTHQERDACQGVVLRICLPQKVMQLAARYLDIVVVGSVYHEPGGGSR